MNITERAAPLELKCLELSGLVTMRYRSKDITVRVVMEVMPGTMENNEMTIIAFNTVLLD